MTINEWTVDAMIGKILVYEITVDEMSAGKMTVDHCRWHDCR
jgi:hypothetical protein